MKAIDDRLAWIAHFLEVCQHDQVGSPELLSCARESLRELLAISEALPEREMVTVIKVEDGDRVLVRTDRRLDATQVNYIRDKIKATFGDIPVLVTGAGLEISLVREIPGATRRSPQRIMTLPEIHDAR